MSRSIGEKSMARTRVVFKLVDCEIKSLEIELKVKDKHVIGKINDGKRKAEML
jgi:hypothetical protein